VLRKRLQRLSRRLHGDVDKLSAAIEREVAGAAGETRKRLAAVHRTLWIGGQPAERAVSGLEYSRLYGDGLLPALIEAYDPYDERERVLVLPRGSTVTADRELSDTETP